MILLEAQTPVRAQVQRSTALTPTQQPNTVVRNYTGLAEARRGAEQVLAPRASGRKERLGAAAPQSGPDPDLVPRGAAVPARRRPGWRCFVTCGLKRASDGQVFSY